MKIRSFMVGWLKKQLERGNMKRRKKFPSFDKFDCDLNVPYMDDDNIHHKFDVFRATEHRKNICVIDIHGGSYLFGESIDNFNFGHYLFNHGLDFAAMDYVPNNGKRDTKDLLDDCYKNIKYLFAHLKEHKLDMDRFVITGDSAGGHLALTMAIAMSNPEYAKELGYDFDGIKVEAVLINCPVFDFEHISSSLSENSKIKMFGPNHSNVEMNKLISPKEHLHQLNMPLFVSTCNHDFLRKESLMIKNMIDENKIYFRFIDIHTYKSYVSHVHNIVFPHYDESIIVNDAMIDFINEVIK